MRLNEERKYDGVWFVENRIFRKAMILNACHLSVFVRFFPSIPLVSFCVFFFAWFSPHIDLR